MTLNQVKATRCLSGNFVSIIFILLIVRSFLWCAGGGGGAREQGAAKDAPPQAGIGCPTGFCGGRLRRRRGGRRGGVHREPEMCDLSGDSVSAAAPSKENTDSIAHGSSFLRGSFESPARARYMYMVQSNQFMVN